MASPRSCCWSWVSRRRWGVGFSSSRAASAFAPTPSSNRSVASASRGPHPRNSASAIPACRPVSCRTTKTCRDDGAFGAQAASACRHPRARIRPYDPRVLLRHGAGRSGRGGDQDRAAGRRAHARDSRRASRRYESMTPISVAILDDFQNVTPELADWKRMPAHVNVTIFNQHFDGEELIRRLSPFDVLVITRERTPFPRSVVERLPNLKLLVTAGSRNLGIELPG